MKNLLEQTENALQYEGKTYEDIAFIGDTEVELTIEQFKELAKSETYAPVSLRVIFHDGSYLYREGYDGREYWKKKNLDVSKAQKYPNITTAKDDIDFCQDVGEWLGIKEPTGGF